MESTKTNKNADENVRAKLKALEQDYRNQKKELESQLSDSSSIWHWIAGTISLVGVSAIGYVLYRTFSGSDE